MGMKQLLTKAALSTAMSCISGAPEKNLPKLLEFVESIGLKKSRRGCFIRSSTILKMYGTSRRKFMYEQVRKFRQTKPIFTMDFWNDGEYAGGCIAGGRRYLHINADGDVDPCVFIVL